MERTILPTSHERKRSSKQALKYHAHPRELISTERMTSIDTVCGTYKYSCAKLEYNKKGGKEKMKQRRYMAKDKTSPSMNYLSPFVK